MFFLDRDGSLAQMRHTELLARSAAARERELWRRLPLQRRIAKPLGRAFVRLGALLLRYGHPDIDIILDHTPRHQSVVLN
jgi:hypothetical protein